MEGLYALILAPAKVNLYLRVLGRRFDGYHLLDSLMVPISLYDRLWIRVGRQRQGLSEGAMTVKVDGSEVPGGPANLAYRATALFLATVRRSVPVDVRIRKGIPPGSGLGGASSDAAAMLLALNRLLGFPLCTQELCDLGARLGADVPFFVYGRAARIRGVGDEVTPVRLPSTLSLVVCSDRRVLSTKRVYEAVDLSLTSTEAVTNIPTFVSGREPISGLLMNDLEAAAAQLHPAVLRIKARLLDEGAQGALMTGSGSAVVGIWPEDRLARRAATRLREQGLWAEAVQTLERSPAVGS
ncbi:MAG: 4-(cytidine 5'-diphospho)-2-C-methyl-D-erythritol kinase [Candidatus Binatia bacterium]